jgi:hypothetical protein
MKTNTLPRLLAALTLISLLFSPAILPAQTRTLPGHRPWITRSLAPLGSLPDTNRLTLAIGLPLRNTAALSNLLQQLYDPRSPNYHHYLTPKQFTEQFGPTEQDYQAVIHFARTNGFTILRTTSNRTLLDVSARVPDVERAFHVRMQTYQHPAEARQFYAPDTEPAVDASLPILAIAGLNNYVLPRPLYKKFSSYGATPGNSMATGSSPSGSYWGNDFRNAYAPGVTLTGSGQSVALFECDGYFTNDVTSYLAATGLPNTPLTNVLVDGFSSQPSGSGGEVEVALDIDMAISMAPGINKVLVYEGPSDTAAIDLDILNRIATDNFAKQISSSWVIGDSAQFEQVYSQFAVQGQSFFQASGDQGAYYPGIFQYEDSPSITLVGGTTLLSTGTGGTWASETVWNAGGGAGGGGVSTTYTIPAYQTNISMASNQGSTTMRNVPDVALTAYNIYIWGDGSPISNIGGTSCAAPLWAGFMALVNQQLASSGQPAAGFINPAIYSLAQTPAYTNLFHDITNGNNTTANSPSKYFAVPGYDLCTGWGTPAGQALINALAPPLTVILPASATEGAGLLAGAGQVVLPAAPSSNVVVTLVSADPAQVSVPAAVTILAGQTNATFDLTILDDGILDGTQIATITATSPLGGGNASMMIFDAETATLQVQLPGPVVKGQGTVQGTVFVSAPVGASVSVTLSSTATNLVQVPATVMIPTGQTSAVFTATILTDGQINGGQIVNVTAHVQDWTDGAMAVTVQDNVNLTVTLPISAFENTGVLTNTGTVSMAGTSTVSQVISLLSGNPALVGVPSTVTIPPGTNSSPFNITMENNPIGISNQTVTVTASASGFTNGSSSMMVLGIGAPPIPGSPAPGNGATNVFASTNLSWSSGSAVSNQLILNGGFETGTFTNWTISNTSSSGTWVINNGSYVPPGPGGTMAPYAGGFSALSEQTGGGTHTLYQDVTIPAGAASAVLSWADRIRNEYTSYTSAQYFHVEIRQTNNSVLQVAFSTQPGFPLINNWTNRSVNLSAYAGQTIRIAFVESDSLFYFNVGVDNVSLAVATSGGTPAGTITNDVYFGTSPTPGASQYQGSTTNSSWTLPLLSPLTTYYWQIVSHNGTTTAGPVWQFTTAGLDHFGLGAVSSPQVVNRPFNLTITAQDKFNNTITSFVGLVTLQCSSGAGSLIEGFESGTWPHSPWITAGSTVGALTNLAHDGSHALTDPDWMYRTDVSIGNGVNSLSWWVRPGGGRAYLGFAATSSGCWSIIAAPNTAQFLLDQNPGYNTYNVISSANQAWQAGAWYLVTVQFNSPSNITCYLYASDGVTLLNSISYASSTSLVGGIAMRSFAGFCVDTITSGSALGGTVPISPTNTTSFVNGVWNGTVTVLQPATNVQLTASDGSGHIGTNNFFNVFALPSITQQPVSQTVLGGSNVTFIVGASGTQPLSYLWQMNSAPLGAANNSTLTLPNVVRANSGIYNVIVTNAVGSAVSSNAVLIVHVPELLGVPTVSSNGTLTFTSGDVGGGTIPLADLTNFTAQASSNLVDWVNLPGALTVTNGMLQLQDPNAGTMPCQFYRIIENW